MTNARPLTLPREAAVPAWPPLAGTNNSAGVPAAHQAVLATLDHLSVALFLSSDRGSVLHANRSAGDLLAAGDGILTDSGQHLKFGNRSLAEVVLRARAERCRIHFAVKRPSGSRPYTVSVIPLVPAMPSQAVAAVFVFDPEDRVAKIPAGLYDLTSKERTIAEHLAQGRSIDEAAATEGIARSTARTHLRHIFDKVGVKRQSELVAVLASGAIFANR